MENSQHIVPPSFWTRLDGNHSMIQCLGMSHPLKDPLSFESTYSHLWLCVGYQPIVFLLNCSCYTTPILSSRCKYENTCSKDKGFFTFFFILCIILHLYLSISFIPWRIYITGTSTDTLGIQGNRTAYTSFTFVLISWHIELGEPSKA